MDVSMVREDSGPAQLAKCRLTLPITTLFTAVSLSCSGHDIAHIIAHHNRVVFRLHRPSRCDACAVLPDIDDRVVKVGRSHD